MLHTLPTDVWEIIGRHVCDRDDLVALALACPRLLPAIRRIVGTRGCMSVRHGVCDAVLSHWRHDVRFLDVRGLEPLRCLRRPLAPLALPAMPLLRRLVLRHPRYPASPFWPAVFAGCPLLEEVEVVCEFSANPVQYEHAARHAVDLVMHGAPRLRQLSITGHGALLDCVPVMPEVSSTTLREYGALCPQAPVAVRASLDHLMVGGRDLVRMAPTDVRRVSARVLSLDELRALPSTVEHLDVRLIARDMSCTESWGTPLAHLSSLRTLAVDMTAPPTGECALDFLRHWLGCPPGIRHVVATFVEPATYALEELLDHMERDSEEFEEALVQWDVAAQRVAANGLDEWLDEHPRASVHLVNFEAVAPSRHPDRCYQLFTKAYADAYM